MKKNKRILTFISLVLGTSIMATVPHKLPHYNKDNTTSMEDDDVDSTDNSLENDYIQNMEVIMPNYSGTVLESIDTITSDNINPYDLFINNINTNFSYNTDSNALYKLLKILNPSSEEYTRVSKIILANILSDGTYEVKTDKNFIYLKAQNSDIAIALHTSINHEGITIDNSYNSISYYSFLKNNSFDKYILNLYNENVRFEYKLNTGVLTLYGNRLSEEFIIPFNKQGLVEQQLFLDYINKSNMNDIINHIAIILSYDVDEGQKLVLK